MKKTTSVKVKSVIPKGSVEVKFCVACNHAGTPRKVGDKLIVTSTQAVTMKTFNLINEDI